MAINSINSGILNKQFQMNLSLQSDILSLSLCDFMQESCFLTQQTSFHLNPKLSNYLVATQEEQNSLSILQKSVQTDGGVSGLLWIFN